MYKLILILLFISQTSLADSTETGPNNVYIQQIGTSNNITIEQVGGTNNVGGTAGTTSVDSAGVTTLTPSAASSINYAMITGSDNIFSITQHGSNNWAQYNLFGNNNTYTSTVTGGNNKTQLVVGNQLNPNNLNNTITESIIGNSNLSIQNIIGNYINSTLSVTGNTNQITQNLTGTTGAAGFADSSNITVSGNSNILNTQESDVGIHSLTENITGSNNAIYTQQQGANNTNVNILTQGDFNTITVRTSSTSIISPQSAIAR